MCSIKPFHPVLVRSSQCLAPGCLHPFLRIYGFEGEPGGRGRSSRASENQNVVGKISWFFGHGSSKPTSKRERRNENRSRSRTPCLFVRCWSSTRFGRRAIYLALARIFQNLTSIMSTNWWTWLSSDLQKYLQFLKFFEKYPELQTFFKIWAQSCLLLVDMTELRFTKIFAILEIFRKISRIANIFQNLTSITSTN